MEQSKLSNEEMLKGFGVDPEVLPSELDNALNHHGVTLEEFKALDPKVVMAIFTMFSFGVQQGAVATAQKIAIDSARRLAEHIAQADKAAQN